MRFLLALLLLLSFSVGATTYTEFYVQTTGANTNSGHTTDDAATFYVASGNWTNTTGTFYKSGLNPAAGGVTNGAWAAIYLDAYPTNAMYIGLITNADDTADVIQVNLVAYAGVNPADGVGTYSISVGGAWAGFTTATMANGGGFPFNFLMNTATNSPNVWPRCNIKSGTTYNVASMISHTFAGPIRWQGYTTTPGDYGKATIDGGTSGAYYTVLTASSTGNDFADLIFSNNGASSGTTDLVITSGLRNTWFRCVFHDSCKAGLNIQAVTIIVECEAYACNKANAANIGAFHCVASGMAFFRCIAHDNSVANGIGFYMPSGGYLFHCLSFGNGNSGAKIASAATVPTHFISCDFYNNGGSGIDLAATAHLSAFIENCNFVKNAAYGITSSGSQSRNGSMMNCGFGSGTQTNASGNIASNLGGIGQIGTVTYAADSYPWTDPANGNFKISLAAAKAMGRGIFTQSTVNSPTNTVGYPDIGAAQSASTNAAGGGAYTFAQ